MVCFEPGERHWHRASPATAMAHAAVQDAFDGRAVDWMEHASDEQFQARTPHTL